MLEKIIKPLKDEIAYKVDDLQISYEELIEKSKLYGELLKKQGNKPVLIYGHKDINTFVAIFSCIYAKRAYVPIDLCTPVDRIKKIIEYTNSNLILTNENLKIDKIEVLSLKQLDKYNECEIKENFNEIAYIIFTSGSTGVPKGVPISYKNLLNFIDWLKTLSPLKEFDKINVLNQASFSFDLSVADIFYSVSNGHVLVALTKENQDKYDEIFRIISENDINLLVVTPTFIKLCLLNKEFNINNFGSLRCIYFCGEQLEVNVVKKIYERFPNINIINAYGPTEATSAVSAINITKNMLNDELLPCGDLNNLATKIIISNNEIILKGSSVFSGYLGDLEGGYYKEDNINCFKTGDIGYIRENKLFCKGRKDSQIKYKGYRIEIGDIENNLYKVKGIKQCAVVAKYKDDFNVKLIKAFVVLEKGYSIDFVKKELKKLIPLYMFPKVIEQIDELPVSCNLKIDRKKLRDL